MSWIRCSSACLLFFLAAEAQRRPTYESWKHGKASEAVTAGATAAKASKMAAVNKVVDLLESLKSQVLVEGEKEAKTYNTFACFCKDTTAEKTDAIQKGSDEKAHLAATIDTFSQERDALDSKITGLVASLAAVDKAMKDAKMARSQELATYEKNSADLIDAIDALQSALQVLKASEAPSLAQLASVRESLRKATLMADALGVGGAAAQKMASLFLQEDAAAPSVPMEDYKFHSGSIIGALEVLLKDFHAEKVAIDSEEAKSVSNFEAFLQEQSDISKQKKIELSDSKAQKARKVEEIASSSEQLSTVAATLLDDQQYLEELSQMCSDKATTWDQRTRVRQDELSTLTSVIAIITGTVSNKTTASTLRFMQRSAGRRLVEAVAANPEAMEAVEADAETVDEMSPSFLQLSKARAASALAPTASQLAKQNDGGRDALVAVLRNKGMQLKSALLTSLASRIAGGSDPFGKVKMLIQELLDRLLTEASSDANQKGWCDKSLSDAEQKRDYANTAVEKFNAKMAQLEALRDTLAADLLVLVNEKTQLEASRAEAEGLRSEEKAQNGMTMGEAQAGLAALEQAIDILNKFYKTATKEEVELSLAQKGPAIDAPDAGFQNGEAYFGAQGESVGIIGMMDVMKSDFQRTIVETEKAEAAAEQDHLAFMTETGKSLAAKTTAHSEKTKQKDDAEESLSEAEAGLQSEMTILQTAVKELMELKPVCIDTGMSYEERVARRADEIAALKKSLCILQAYAEYGPNGLSDAC